MKFAVPLIPGILVIFSIALPLLPGCSSIYAKPTADPATGSYGSKPFEQSDISKYQPYAGISSIGFVYLRTFSVAKPEHFQKYIEDGLQQIGIKRIYTLEQLSQHVVATGIADKVGSLNDMLGLNRLYKIVGPYLAVDVSIQHLGGAWSRASVTILDPSKPEIILKASRDSVAWISYDKEIAGPLLDLLKRYYEESAKLPTPERPGPPPGTNT